MDIDFRWSIYKFRKDGTYFCDVLEDDTRTSWWRWNNGVMEWQHPFDRKNPSPSGWSKFESNVIEGVTEAYCNWLADQIVGAS